MAETSPEISKKEYSEIEFLKERIEKLESQLRKEKEMVSEEKERIVKKEIKSYLQEMQQTPAFVPSPTTRDEVKEIIKLEPNQQVGALVNLVFDQGLHKAISLARILNNPAVLDEFHDTLVDRYFELLIEKGILKL